MTKIAAVLITMVFLAGLAALTLTAPRTSTRDDGGARFEVDQRSEPRP